MAASLKQRFLLATLLVYLVTAIASYGALAWIADSIVGNLGRAFVEKQVQYSRSQSLAPLLREVALASKMADSPLLRDWAAHEDDAELRRRALAELESYRRSFRDGSFFFAINGSGNYYFNDAKGSYTGNELRYTLNSATPADQWYFATVRAGLDYQINVNSDEHLKVTKVWVNVLMRDGDRVLGVVGTGIDLSTFIHEVVESGEAGIENIFIDGSGAIQAHKNVGLIDFASLTRSRDERLTLARLIDDEAGRQAFADAMARRDGQGDGGVETLMLSVAGQRHLVALTHLKEIHWYAVTLVDLDVLMRQGRFLSVAVLVCIALLAAMVSITVLLDRLVLARVLRLDASTHRIASNDFSLDLTAGPQDEIGRLTSSFQRMADTVRTHTETLESRVRAAIAEYETANRKLEDQAGKLADSNAELEQFAYVVSHDLRQPLRMVTSYLGLIERKFGTAIDGDLKGYLNYAVDGARRMDRMIQDLLKYSRTGRDAPPMEMTPLDVVVAESLESFAPAIAELQAVVTVSPGLPAVLGNHGELIRLFENLIGNALKYRVPNRQPQVGIDWQDGGSEWRVRVQDNGIGIPAEDIDRVFMVFQRSGLASDFDGTGIGLAICRKIVERHGGQIHADSVVGEGSCFVVSFPKVPR